MSTEAWLFSGLIFGSIGSGYALYGKKQHRPVALLSGIGLIAFPYFVETLTATLAIGLALMALPFLVRR